MSIAKLPESLLRSGAPTTPGRFHLAAHETNYLSQKNKIPSGARDSVGSSVMYRRLGIGREGGIGGRSAQQVERHFDRLIVRLIGGHIGLRASLLGTLGFEVAAQRGFALGVDLSLHVIRNVLQDFDVRHDAL